MRVEMKTLYATPERTVQAGEQAVFPREEAEALIAGGFARAVDEDGAVRTRPAASASNRGKPRGKTTAED